MQSFSKMEMDLDEFEIVMRNIDFWERKVNAKFVEADVDDGKAEITFIPVATTGFFMWIYGGEAKLMAELVIDTRVGYIDLGEFAEFDKELFHQLKTNIINENGGESLDGRYFPRSQESIELFDMLTGTAKWEVKPVT
ncbi:MAG: hypothetical protein ACLFVI_03920 [Archaeoglobaceae archaeon]